MCLKIPAFAQSIPAVHKKSRAWKPWVPYSVSAAKYRKSKPWSHASLLSLKKLETLGFTRQSQLYLSSQNTDYLKQFSESPWPPNARIRCPWAKLHFWVARNLRPLASLKVTTTLLTQHTLMQTRDDVLWTIWAFALQGKRFAALSGISCSGLRSQTLMDPSWARSNCARPPVQCPRGQACCASAHLTISLRNLNFFCEKSVISWRNLRFP
jgi:hypothetical protein